MKIAEKSLSIHQVVTVDFWFFLAVIPLPQ